jgi:glycosyltransferase involved in cell wall biosynthesis
MTGPKAQTATDRTLLDAHEHGSIRVAMVYASDFEKASAGGITTMIRETITRLSGQFPVLFVGVGNTNDGEAMRQRVGVPSMRVLPVFPITRRPRWLPLNILFTLVLFRRKKEICQLADVIHVHRMETALPFISRKSRPVLLTVHGSSKFHAVTQTGPLRWRIVKFVYDIVEGLVLSRVDRVILVSQDAREYYSIRHPDLRHKFAVIPNFIENSAFRRIERTPARAMRGFTESDIVIAYAGRLVREKRVDLLIDAFAKLLAERPSAHLFIAGEGPDEARLRDQVTRQNLGHVHFLGLLPRHEVHQLLAGADSLVLPSRFEGFPMVVLEALACGVPVVAADVGGVREILKDGLECFIWRTDNPEELKCKILEAVDRRMDLRDLCISLANRFDAARILPRLEELYADLVSDSPEARAQCVLG